MLNFRAFKDNTISEDYKNQILAIDLHTNNTGKVSLKGIIEEIDAESKLLVFNDDRLKNEILIDNEKENPLVKHYIPSEIKNLKYSLAEI